MTGLVDLLEALTIFCFGLSWPIFIDAVLYFRNTKLDREREAVETK